MLATVKAIVLMAAFLAAMEFFSTANGVVVLIGIIAVTVSQVTGTVLKIRDGMDQRKAVAIAQKTAKEHGDTLQDIKELANHTNSALETKNTATETEVERLRAENVRLTALNERLFSATHQQIVPPS